MLVAGFLAEQEIFGAELVKGGSESDMEKVTEMTVTYFKECGFGGTFIRIAPTEDYYDHAYHNVSPIQEHALNFIKQAQSEATKILCTERRLLIQLSKILADQAVVE